MSEHYVSQGTETEVKAGSTETVSEHYVSLSTEKLKGQYEQDSGGTTAVSEHYCKPDLEGAETDRAKLAYV